MSGLEPLGRMLVLLGLLLLLLGGLLLVVGKVPLLGRLPGDIVIERKHFTVYFPLATSILLSVVLTLLLTLFSRR